MKWQKKKDSRKQSRSTKDNGQDSRKNYELHNTYPPAITYCSRGHNKAPTPPNGEGLMDARQQVSINLLRACERALSLRAGTSPSVHMSPSLCHGEGTARLEVKGPSSCIGSVHARQVVVASLHSLDREIDKLFRTMLIIMKHQTIENLFSQRSNHLLHSSAMILPIFHSLSFRLFHCRWTKVIFSILPSVITRGIHLPSFLPMILF